MKNITIEKLKDLELFKNLKEGTLYKLVTFGRVKNFKKNEIIFRDKDKVEIIYVVLGGKFSLYKIGEDAQKRVVYILGRDKILNDVILDNLPASIYCECFEEGQLLMFHKSEFIKVMESDFQLTTVVLNSLSIKVRRLYRQIKNTNPNKKIEKKIAAKVWKFSRDYGIDIEYGTEINLTMSITYLADMFGSQRETVSRALKVLENEELIFMKNKKIVVRDREKLLKYFKGLWFLSQSFFYLSYKI